jgi:hypothetical protein
MQIEMPYEHAGPDGVVKLSFPDDGTDAPAYTKFIRNLQRLAAMDETEVVELLSSKEGAESIGGVEFEGEVDPWELAEESGSAPEADLGPLSASEYEVFLQGGDPQRGRRERALTSAFEAIQKTLEEFVEVREGREKLTNLFSTWHHDLQGDLERHEQEVRVRRKVIFAPKIKSKVPEREQSAMLVYNQVVEMYVSCLALQDHWKALRSEIAEHDGEVATEIRQIALSHFTFMKSELSRAVSELGQVLQKQKAKAKV